jgi:hypothetical protein
MTMKCGGRWEEKFRKQTSHFDTLSPELRNTNEKSFVLQISAILVPAMSM